MLGVLFFKFKKCNNFVNTNYAVIMDVPIIKIGNSKGIRLSKTILEKYNIKDTVELIMEKGYLIIKPKDEPRKGWEKSFKEMRDMQDDELLIDDVFEDEDHDPWK